MFGEELVDTQLDVLGQYLESSCALDHTFSIVLFLAYGSDPIQKLHRSLGSLLLASMKAASKV